MNHVYRVVWNEASASFVAVCEIAAARGKRSSLKRSAMVSLLAWMGLVGSSAWALPQGGAVVAGTATLGTVGSTLTVNQSTQAVSLNWTHFNVAAGELVNFVQPTNGIALNYVSNASTIAGSLQANGSVFLMAPGGLLIGPSAQIQVGGVFGASSLPLDSYNPVTRRVTFAKVSGTPGKIINQGQ
ncbi:MAG TPA: filamentous hemagglutinin N-terminal domain-containing protein, partial [Aquabacterium sp.]|nr:filamentous hemagglutinin N-terminal domain-containing protein [Aquabacterium sp.]